MDNDYLIRIIKELTEEMGKLKKEINNCNEKIEMLQVSQAMAQNPNMVNEQTRATGLYEGAAAISGFENNHRSAFDEPLEETISRHR